MGLFRNEVENTKDYLGDDPMFTNLMDMHRRPEGEEIMTHLRVLYGHVDWDNLIVELDPQILRLLQDKKLCVNGREEVLIRRKVEDYVALLNADTMGPLYYNDLKSKYVDVELLDREKAIEKAAKWFVDDLFDSGLDFGIFATYFLIAFRLSLLDNKVPDELRFTEERLNEVWKNTFSLVMIKAGQKLQLDAINPESEYLYIHFDLHEHEVNRYLSSMKA